PCGGVCTNLKTDPGHCGACGKACGPGQICDGGACVASCAPPLVVCGGACVDTRFDVSHCNACDVVCSSPHGKPACLDGGGCALGACDPGWLDCNGTVADGCETDPRTSLTSCGFCGNVCPARANATPTCAARACGFACNTGFRDCNGNPADGCEINNQTDRNNCGACGNVCPGVQPCVAGACVLPIPAGCRATAIPNIVICISSQKVNTYATAAQCMTCTERGLTNACIDTASCTQGYTNAIVERLYLERTGLACTSQLDQSIGCGWGEVMTANYQAPGNCPTPADCTSVNWQNCTNGTGAYDAYIFGVCRLP
ncbi:MAG: hypothetical protein WCJ30_26105, partial [Deltaproteobacteria bacterium]